MGLQDFKLHILRWQFLPSMGRLLHELSMLLAASNHSDHYRRDLGMANLTSTSGSTSGISNAPSAPRGNKTAAERDQDIAQAMLQEVCCTMRLNVSKVHQTSDGTCLKLLGIIHSSLCWPPPCICDSSTSQKEMRMYHLLLCSSPGALFAVSWS